VKEVITRFAPSPTGYLHIGGARTALFSWAYAKKYQGKFILRVEDTDLERSTPEAIEAIKDGMEWLELDYDGPIYFQTQRFERYTEVINQMLKDGLAYHCYSSKEELEKVREAQMSLGKKPKYDGKWRPEINKTLPSIPDHTQPVIRFKNPTDGAISWKDLVKGVISIQNQELDDFIIARSDGSPTYNFCVVVDDWDMNISHVIRGDDHINNTPRQINLLHALQAPVPEYAHLSMILGSDGQKLSKRHGAVSVTHYRDMGYVHEAVKNYLARLGWSHGDDEIFSMKEFCTLFDFDHVTSSAAQFNDEKLDWLNNHYIKAMAIDELTELLNPPNSYDNELYKSAVMLYRDRAKSLNEIAESIHYFFSAPVISQELLEKYINADAMRMVENCMQGLNEKVWNDESINQYLKDFVKEEGIKFPIIAMPLRTILAGTDHTPSVGSIIAIMGKNEVNQRWQDFKSNYDN
jgi:glutamyl-tRNA synthetase|tara:strand:+ start:4262 stop:5653 length:1392 start_codon:yes stop_codon:yes gene_type:complete